LGGIESSTDPDEYERVQTELDAAAFHAYRGHDQNKTRRGIVWQCSDKRLLAGTPPMGGIERGRGLGE